MAADSLVGDSFNTLSEDAQNLVNAVLGDTQNEGGVTSTVTQTSGGTVVVGTGANNEVQGVIVGNSGQVVTGEVQSGTLTLNVSVPASLATAFEGLSSARSTEEVKNYLDNFINEAVGTDQEFAANLRDNVAELINALNVNGSGNVEVRIIAFTTGSSAQSLTTADQVVTFTGDGASDELLVFVMSQLGEGTLQISDVKAAMMVGGGKLVVADDKGTAVTGDLTNQIMTGGAGADTLLGGGGSDTLTGGDGADIFGMRVFGDLTITDFNVAQDKLAFLGDNFNSLDELAAQFTGLTINEGSVSLGFTNGTITLVGVNAEDLTLDLLQYTLGS